MKKILSILVACIALFGVSTASAQSYGRWAAVAGMDITSLKFDQNLLVIPQDNLSSSYQKALIIDQNVGVTAGVMGELMFPGIGFGLDASLLYTQRGAKLHMGDFPIWAKDGYGKENCLLHYIEIPIHLKFKFKNLNGLENTFMPMLFAGPEFSLLVGHSKIDAIQFTGGEFGVNVGAGFELFRKVQVNASYCWGLSYALKTKVLDDFSANNRTWKISAAYFF